MYANLASCANLGSTIGGNFGAFFLEVTSVTPDGTESDQYKFKNLWMPVCASIFLPLIPVLFTSWFIPDKTGTDKIFEEDDVLVSEGSLLKRLVAWMGSS